MRTLALSVLLSLAGADGMLAQVEGFRLLFPADSTTITEDDQRAIFDLLGTRCRPMEPASKTE